MEKIISTAKLKNKNIEKIISTAKLRNARISPRKMAFVADSIRGENASSAIVFLENIRRAASPYLVQLIKSAISNAQQKDSQVVLDKLIINTIKVDKSFVLKRLRPRAMGRGSLIRKKSSHIFIGLSY